MAAPTTLATLPAEIFERVALAADKFDLPSLRLVSRECNNKSLRTFTQAYFHHRSVLLSEIDSIEDTIVLAKHTTFGKAMRHLSICLNDMPAPPHGTGQSTLHLRKEVRARVGSLYQAMLDRVACRATNSVLNALTVLLMRLRADLTAITITDIAALRNAGVAAPITSNECFGMLVLPDRNELQVSHNIILEAIAVSEVPLEELKIRSRWLFLRPDHFTDVDTFASVMRTISILEMATCVETGAIASNVDVFVDALARAPNLQNLKLKVASPHYTCWHLQGLNVDSAILVQLMTLRRFEKLERLVIKGATLGARAISAWTAKQPALNRLELDEIVVQDYDLVAPNDECMTMIVKRLSGVEEVQVGRIHD